jgi:hypothetical protein
MHMDNFDSISISMSARSMDPGMWDDPNYHFDLTSEHVHDFHANGSLLPGGEKISDAYVYGPRFCDIYDAFNATRLAPIDPSRHLMSLCTQYLVEFCLWARESIERTNYIRERLMDHEYLRSEVRNGIVMVIIYTFASTKATILDQADMFTTLQDHERGLGIANKFSLRIYNDPYNYLSFLKSSISSLIDAGIIPDNERLNQPKKNKLKYENKEEFSAFTQIQNMLVAALDAGNNVAAKNLVNHITGFWSQRGKFIRNRRFQSALQFIQENPVPKTVPLSNNNLGAASVDGSDYTTTITSMENKSVASSTTSYSMPPYPYATTANAAVNYHPPAQAVYYPAGFEHPPPHHSFTASSGFPGQAYGAVALSDKQQAVIQAPVTQHAHVGGSDKSQSLYAATTAKPSEIAAAIPTKATFIRPSATPLPISNNSGATAEITQSARNHLSNNSAAQLTSNEASHHPVKPRTSSLSHPLTFFNFDRIGMNEWKIRGIKIFHLDPFMQSLTEDLSATGIYLVDDQKLAPLITLNVQSSINGNFSASVSGGKFLAREGGLLSLREELGHTDTLVASWNSRGDYRQFEGFIRRYCNAVQAQASDGSSSSGASKKDDVTATAATLLSVWQEDSSLDHAGKKRSRSDNDLTSMLSPVTTSGRGVIVYETVTQMGFVIRKNLQLGMTHDLWCLLYPNDMYASSSDSSYLFEHYVISLLPQYRSVAATLSKKEVVVKYYCHRHHANATSASSSASTEGSTVWKDVPKLADESAYRTIGTMSQSAYSLLSK